ncbi:MAG: CsiV family protein [Woeseiaceae bacterium]
MRAAFCVAVVALAAAVLPAFAQQDAEVLPGEETGEAVEPVRRYTVELIIFSYGEGASAGTEIWIADEPAVEVAPDPADEDYFDTDLYEFSEPGEVLAEIEAPAIARRYMDLELVLLDTDTFTMNQIYDKLVELDAYEPIMRAGWTQPTYEKDMTASIGLRTLGDPPPGLDGTLTLYLGRYLHLVVDLTMDKEPPLASPPEETSASVLTFGDSRIQNEYELIDQYGELLPPPIRYRIFEDRIMKNGDIRYFDHPKFGVIAKITRVEEAEEEIIDDTEDLLPGSLLSP